MKLLIEIKLFSELRYGVFKIAMSKVFHHNTKYLTAFRERRNWFSLSLTKRFENLGMVSKLWYVTRNKETVTKLRNNHWRQKRKEKGTLTWPSQRQSKKQEWLVKTSKEATAETLLGLPLPTFLLCFLSFSGTLHTVGYKPSSPSLESWTHPRLLKAHLL